MPEGGHLGRDPCVQQLVQPKWSFGCLLIGVITNIAGLVMPGEGG